MTDPDLLIRLDVLISLVAILVVLVTVTMLFVVNFYVWVLTVVFVAGIGYYTLKSYRVGLETGGRASQS
ncbi:hypothetical protein [Haladaptatus sp. DJG-WS-42]|uniref:hypothetical protein n=1 Tax=Haladaptatus sp. DJG-WS-42 TaxID=3120516 RepID=UPI0030D243BB